MLMSQVEWLLLLTGGGLWGYLEEAMGILVGALCVRVRPDPRSENAAPREGVRW